MPYKTSGMPPAYNKMQSSRQRLVQPIIRYLKELKKGMSYCLYSKLIILLINASLIVQIFTDFPLRDEVMPIATLALYILYFKYCQQSPFKDSQFQGNNPKQRIIGIAIWSLLLNLNYSRFLFHILCIYYVFSNICKTIFKIKSIKKKPKIQHKKQLQPQVLWVVVATLVANLLFHRVSQIGVYWQVIPYIVPELMKIRSFVIEIISQKQQTQIQSNFCYKIPQANKDDIKQASFRQFFLQVTIFTLIVAQLGCLATQSVHKCLLLVTFIINLAEITLYTLFFNKFVFLLDYANIRNATAAQLAKGQFRNNNQRKLPNIFAETSCYFRHNKAVVASYCCAPLFLCFNCYQKDVANQMLRCPRCLEYSFDYFTLYFEYEQLRNDRDCSQDGRKVRNIQLKAIRL